MQELLTQIEEGLNNNLYYMSLFVALSIPDICGAIESKNGEATGEKYEKWFDDYMTPKYSGNLNGKEIYRIRCSLLHQGICQHTKSKYSRVLFTIPSGNQIIIHNNVLADSLNLDLVIFCKDIITGARDWLNKIEGTPAYEKNYKKFISYYPNGFPPYILGFPVIG